MTTNIRGRRQTGRAFRELGPELVRASTNFHITKVDGVFASESDQAYFWTEEWQKGEREADEDIRADRVTAFDNVEDALRHLRDL